MIHLLVRDEANYIQDEKRFMLYLSTSCGVCGRLPYGKAVLRFLMYHPISQLELTISLSRHPMWQTALLHYLELMISLHAMISNYDNTGNWLPKVVTRCSRRLRDKSYLQGWKYDVGKRKEKTSSTRRFTSTLALLDPEFNKWRTLKFSTWFRKSKLDRDLTVVAFP